jgi:Flp pilus assembly CpaF family ATPase
MNLILPLDGRNYIEELLKMDNPCYFIRQQSFLLNHLKIPIQNKIDYLSGFINNLYSNNIHTKNTYIHKKNLHNYDNNQETNLDILFLPTMDGYLWQLCFEKNINDITFLIKDKIYIKIRHQGIYFILGFISPLIYNQWIMFWKIKLKLNLIDNEPSSTIINFSHLHLRWSLFPVVEGTKTTIRILNNQFTDLSNLNLHPQIESILLNIIIKKTFIGICGLTGTGKTTLAYGINKYLIGQGFHWISMEQPIEYKNDFFDQSVDTLDKNYLMNQLLRHDIDGVFFGEILDDESARNVLQFIHTGHGVISTFHIGKPKEILNRWKNMEFSGFLIFPKILFLENKSHMLLEIYDDNHELIGLSHKQQMDYLMGS